MTKVGVNAGRLKPERCVFFHCCAFHQTLPSAKGSEGSPAWRLKVLLWAALCTGVCWSLSFYKCIRRPGSWPPPALSSFVRSSGVAWTPGFFRCFGLTVQLMPSFFTSSQHLYLTFIRFFLWVFLPCTSCMNHQPVDETNLKLFLLFLHQSLLLCCPERLLPGNICCVFLNPLHDTFINILPFW